MLLYDSSGRYCHFEPISCRCCRTATTTAATATTTTTTTYDGSATSCQHTTRHEFSCGCRDSTSSSFNAMECYRSAADALECGAAASLPWDALPAGATSASKLHKCSAGASATQRGAAPASAFLPCGCSLIALQPSTGFRLCHVAADAATAAAATAGYSRTSWLTP